MDTLVLKPRFFSASSGLFLIAAIIVTGIMGFTIWPRLYELYTLNPTLPEVWQVFFGKCYHTRRVGNLFYKSCGFSG